MNTNKKLVVVLGAGVIGLQTSISLLREGYHVVIIAKHFPGDESIDYTSPWAGAQWRSHARSSETELQEWDAITYTHWLKVIEEENSKENLETPSGLAFCEAHYYTDAIPDTPWFSNTVLNYEPVERDALEPGFQHGHTYTTILINSRLYLPYLHTIARSLGAHDIRATLPADSFPSTLQHAARLVHSSIPSLASAPIAAFVNATGLAARSLVPDHAVHPVRGQTVLVAGEAAHCTTTETHDGGNLVTTYVIPRPRSGTTVLGGTREVDSWDGVPDAETTGEILRRAKRWAPELLDGQGEFKVLGEGVGLRPGRWGGPRVEVEEVGGRVVCHAYGHAGAGYQNSVGSAGTVVRLLGEWFRNMEKGIGG